MILTSNILIYFRRCEKKTFTREQTLLITGSVRSTERSSHQALTIGTLQAVVFMLSFPRTAPLPVPLLIQSFFGYMFDRFGVRSALGAAATRAFGDG